MRVLGFGAKILFYSIYAIKYIQIFISLSLVDRQRVFDNEGLVAFATQLKTIRKKKMMGQEQLAYKSGLTLSQIARIETAKGNPTLSTVFVLARALEVDLKELFDFPLPESMS